MHKNAPILLLTQNPKNIPTFSKTGGGQLWPPISLEGEWTHPQNLGFVRNFLSWTTYQKFRVVFIRHGWLFETRFLVISLAVRCLFWPIKTHRQRPPNAKNGGAFWELSRIVGWFEGLWIPECENNGKYSPAVTISFILHVLIPGVCRIDRKLSCDSQGEWLQVN